MKQTGNTILITGGGSGIGEALAHRLHDAGNVVIVAGRRRETLERAAKGRVDMHVRTLDVESAEAITTFAAELVRDFPALNVLVNNAGIMKLEDASRRRDLADAEATVTTNLLGPVRLIDALIDHLAGRDDAAIVNVTSGLAFVPLIDAPVYSATKAAIHSYTAALRELLGGRIEMIELAPPGVQTDLTPGQADRPGYMPLDAFVEEAFALLQQQPTPREILVERVRPLREAERNGRFDETLTGLNQMARQQRNGS